MRGVAKSDYELLQDKMRELRRENAELRADKDRLDWLSTESGSKWVHHESEQCNITRRAIDAARKKNKS